jgi:integrase
MPDRDAGGPARGAIDEFISYLASRQFAEVTLRIRKHYLDEYLQRAEVAAGKTRLTVGQLMDQADAWLADAAAGKTRTRNTLRGPTAAAFSNSMRVRIDTFNAFAEYLGRPERLDSPPPADGYALAPADTERLLHDLAVRRPVYANTVTLLRTAAVAALVADTGRSVPDLANLTVKDLHLDGQATVDLPDGPAPVSDATVQIVHRWLSARAAIIADLEGSDPGYLWIPTKPGRPRGGQAAVKPGLTPAAVRTLHAAHRTHVSQVLGAPLRPGAFHSAPAEAGPEQAGQQQA